MPDPYPLLRRAVLERLHVIALHQGRCRELCVHALGSKRGRPHALAYQFAGESASGLAPDGSPQNWRCLRVADVTVLALREGPWHTAPNYSGPHPCIDNLDVQVDP